jgi:uncharacterized protein
MPTEILRRRGVLVGKAASSRAETTETTPRIAVLKVRTLLVRVSLAATATADRIWQQLPFNSTAETWGDALHFETHVESGRDRTARLTMTPRDVAYWSEDDRILFAWGPTPISRPTEIRLMRPCNIWATALDDTSVLAVVTPGERVMLARAP